MGLYNDRVGAVSCESNFAAGQMIDKEYDSLEEYLEYGVQNNIPDINPYEKKHGYQVLQLCLKGWH